MRSRKKSNGLIVNAIAGSYVVFFGLDLGPDARKGFRGFAFRRKDHSDGEIIWLRGIKTFEKTEPHPEIGETFSTQKHPVQSFQWVDYSVKPGIEYSYSIICLYGDPADLKPKIEVNINIITENEIGAAHSAFFNRGSVATQEYARRFLNKPPDKAGPGAYEWLSRGLKEAMISFIERAKSGDSLHGAVYEFQWHEVLKAISDAKKRGVKVYILYDYVKAYDKKKKPLGPWKNNRDAINDAKIQSVCKGRENAKLMHNKFFVLSRGNKPTAVWTGSTNITVNGIFGHSNLGHIVEDKTVAQRFLDYWKRLDKDPEIDKSYRDSNIDTFSIPVKFKKGIYAVFSPRGTNLDTLDWYAKIAGSAKNGLFMTFAFGMHEKFREVYRKKDNVLKMSLMEKAYGSPKVKEKDEKEIQAIRNLPNVVIAIGNRIVTNSFDRWLEEMRTVDGKGKHVYWIHTKYMLVDPLGDEPIVISGSANFSKASTDTNDENMLVIKGDKRIADIYFGEYIRLYAHYAFREAVKWAMDKKKLGKPQNWKPQYLDPTDTWMKDYFNETDDKSARCARRKYFAGTM